MPHDLAKPSTRPVVAWQWLRHNTFAPSWLQGRWRHPVVGYVFAVLVQVFAVLLPALLPATADRFAFATALVLLAVVLVALNWGVGPSLVAAIVGALLVDLAELPPQLSWVPESFWDGVTLVLLVGVSLAMSLLASTVERSKRQAVVERSEAQVQALALQQTQERMDEFIAIASHDLRSPVAAAQGFNEVAARRYERLAAAILPRQADLAGQVEAVRTTLQEASQQVERLGRLIDLLFATTQARAGKLALHRTPCNLAAIVQDQVRALRVAHPSRTLQLEVPSEESVPVVGRAPTKRPGVTNYVTNALKYSPADQPVAIRVASGGAWARVSVEDHGPGLPAPEQARVWERFYQAEGLGAQSSDSGAGLGLGLHISKAIIVSHEGAVGVESAVGKGSTFWFTLPLTEETS
jgi:signal transduction histidine kinase